MKLVRGITGNAMKPKALANCNCESEHWRLMVVIFRPRGKRELL